jgi:hypothetical protein
VKPDYEELEEIVALASALVVSTRHREREAMKVDYEALSFALRHLHERYPDAEWTVAIIDALARAEERALNYLPFPLL